MDAIIAVDDVIQNAMDRGQEVRVGTNSAARRVTFNEE
jgi:hypothetical protein